MIRMNNPVREFVLCTLTQDCCMQQYLGFDIAEGENVELYHNGGGEDHIHITG